MASTSTATVEVHLDAIERKSCPNHVSIEENSSGTADQAVQDEGLPQSVTDQPTTVDRPLALKLISAGFSFFLAGVNDGSLGTLIPYFRQTYNIGFSSTTIM